MSSPPRVEVRIGSRSLTRAKAFGPRQSRVDRIPRHVQWQDGCGSTPRSSSLTRRVELRYARAMRTASLLVLACLLASPGAHAKHLHLRRPARGFQMRMESFVVPPGGDREG